MVSQSWCEVRKPTIRIRVMKMKRVFAILLAVFLFDACFLRQDGDHQRQKIGNGNDLREYLA